MAERVKDGIFGAMMDVSLVNDVSAPFINRQAVSGEQRVHVCTGCRESFKGRLLRSAVIWAVRRLLSSSL